MIADGWNHLVVQIGNDALAFALQFLGRFAELRIQLASHAFEWRFPAIVLWTHIVLSPWVTDCGRPFKITRKQPLCLSTLDDTWESRVQQDFGTCTQKQLLALSC